MVTSAASGSGDQRRPGDVAGVHVVHCLAGAEDGDSGSCGEHGSHGTGVIAGRTIDLHRVWDAREWQISFKNRQDFGWNGGNQVQACLRFFTSRRCIALYDHQGVELINVSTGRKEAFEPKKGLIHLGVITFNDRGNIFAFGYRSIQEIDFPFRHRISQWIDMVPIDDNVRGFVFEGFLNPDYIRYLGSRWVVHFSSAGDEDPLSMSLYDITTAKKVATIPGAMPIDRMQVSYNGDIAIVTLPVGQIKVHDIRLKQSRTMPFTGEVYCLSADGMIAAGDIDIAVAPSGPAAWIRQAMLFLGINKTPTGRRVVLADTTTGEELATYEGRACRVSRAMAGRWRSSSMVRFKSGICRSSPVRPTGSWREAVWDCCSSLHCAWKTPRIVWKLLRLWPRRERIRPLAVTDPWVNENPAAELNEAQTEGTANGN